MNTYSSISTRVAVAVLSAIVVVPVAHAQQERRDRREAERFHTPHWVLDNRYHHNHYYPAPGYSVTVLPAGHVTVTFRGGQYFYHSGVWFQRGGPGFIVVRPPLGVVVPVLPPAYTMVWVAGAPYYYANDAYYVAAPGGYAIAEPPGVPAEAPVQAPPPVAGAPVQSPPPVAAAPRAEPAPGNPPPAMWYYCESAQGYYPYVSECREGWRPVPATPPR
ncbi:MAG TPA: DUF6515 family protein [Burkholderiales bacterium]|nr:DUF6515 family protein [Burkholderiales bacterium]